MAEVGTRRPLTPSTRLAFIRRVPVAATAPRDTYIQHRSPRSFNTAQKKALEKEKGDLEKEAQKRIAEERAKEEARARRPVV